MRLPLRLSWDMASERWASILAPFIAFPPNNGLVLKNIALVTGTNVVSHRLGRVLQGWKPTRVRALAALYDLQDSNQTPELTLVLVSDANVTVDLEVF